MEKMPKKQAKFNLINQKNAADVKTGGIQS